MTDLRLVFRCLISYAKRFLFAQHKPVQAMHSTYPSLADPGFVWGTVSRLSRDIGANDAANCKGNEPFLRLFTRRRHKRSRALLYPPLSFQGSWKSVLYMQIAFKQRCQVVIVWGYVSKVALTSLPQCPGNNYCASSGSSSSSIL